MITINIDNEKAEHIFSNRLVSLASEYGRYSALFDTFTDAPKTTRDKWTHKSEKASDELLEMELFISHFTKQTFSELYDTCLQLKKAYYENDLYTLSHVYKDYADYKARTKIVCKHNKKD